MRPNKPSLPTPSRPMPILSPGTGIIYQTRDGKKVKAVIENIDPSRGVKVRTVKTGKLVAVPFNRIVSRTASQGPSSTAVRPVLMFKIGDTVTHKGLEYKITAVNNDGPVAMYQLDGMTWTPDLGFTKKEKKPHWSDGVPDVLRDPATWTRTVRQCTCGESFVSGESDTAKHSSWCDLRALK